MRAAYSESHRAYHTLQHLSECLQKLDWAFRQGALQKAALTEMALWYHDAIYRPAAEDNESRSAARADEFLHNAGLSTKKRELVHSLIMATRLGATPKEYPHRLVVDIDLSILGSNSERYREYELQIRDEYKRVPSILFKQKRIEFLLGLLQAPRIYHTALFHVHLEQRARENLKQSIRRLTDSP